MSLLRNALQLALAEFMFGIADAKLAVVPPPLPATTASHWRKALTSKAQSKSTKWAKAGESLAQLHRGRPTDRLDVHSQRQVKKTWTMQFFDHVVAAFAQLDWNRHSLHRSRQASTGCRSRPSHALRHRS